MNRIHLPSPSLNLQLFLPGLITFFQPFNQFCLFSSKFKSFQCCPFTFKSVQPRLQQLVFCKMFPFFCSSSFGIFPLCVLHFPSSFLLFSTFILLHVLSKIHFTAVPSNCQYFLFSVLFCLHLAAGREVQVGQGDLYNHYFALCGLQTSGAHNLKQSSIIQ